MARISCIRNNSESKYYVNTLHTRVQVIQGECWVATVVYSTSLHFIDQNVYEQVYRHNIHKDKQPSQGVLLDQPHSSRCCGIQCPAKPTYFQGYSLLATGVGSALTPIQPTQFGLLLDNSNVVSAISF